MNTPSIYTETLLSGVSLQFANVRYYLYALAFMVIGTLCVYEPKKKQKYADVPIVGIASREDLPAARQCFRTSAKAILSEGYSSVGA